MKKLTVIFFIFCFSQASAQTPNILMNNKGRTNKAISARNPWLGGQVGYKFGGSGEFADNLIASARLMYDIDLGFKRFQLPIMGNFSQLRDNLSEKLSVDDKNEARIQDIITSTQGLNLGLYPYFVVSEKQYFAFLIHGAAAYKINSFKDESANAVYLQQGRFSLGIEANIGKYNTEQGRYPWTISIAPALTVFSSEDYRSIFGADKSSLTSLEITSVIPIGKGIGFLLESVISKESAFRTGLLFSSELSKN
jgi:hypothetical protein